MKTRLAALASASLLGALAGAGGCTPNRASVETQMLCVPNETCKFAATCDAQYIGYPTVDLAASTTKTLWLLVQVANQLPNNANVAAGRVNTNDAHIDTTAVEYQGAMTGTQAVGSNLLVPAAGSAVVSAKLDLSGATGGAGAAANVVVAHLKFRGYYDDGTRFETGDFPITVLVCSGGCAPAPACTNGTCPPASGGQLPITCAK